LWQGSVESKLRRNHRFSSIGTNICTFSQELDKQHLLGTRESERNPMFFAFYIDFDTFELNQSFQ
jgi:hypothetical protein